MTEQKSKAIMVNSIMLIAIITAYICRFIGKGAFYPTFLLICEVSFISAFSLCGESLSDSVLSKNRRKNI